MASRAVSSVADYGESLQVVRAQLEPGRRIPLLGMIAAGSPLPAFQVLESIDVPGGSGQIEATVTGTMGGRVTPS